MVTYQRETLEMKKASNEILQAFESLPDKAYTKATDMSVRNFNKNKYQYVENLCKQTRLLFKSFIRRRS